MPNTPLPLGRSAVGGPWWTSILQQITAQQQQINQLSAGQQQTNTVDQYGNVTAISGQLNQVVTIGASHGSPGVLVATGLPGTGQPNAGLAVQQGLVIGALTLVEGNATATSVSFPNPANPTGPPLPPAVFVVGQMIGAADVSDPTSGVATPAITPGTYVQAVSGTTVTLSQAAAESGVGLSAAGATWTVLSE